MTKNLSIGGFQPKNRNSKIINDNNALREYFGTADPHKILYLHRSMEQLPKMQVNSQSSSWSAQKEPVTTTASNRKIEAPMMSLVGRSLDSDGNFNSPK